MRLFQTCYLKGVNKESMTMKKYKTSYDEYHNDDYDHDQDDTKKKSLRDHRRPIRNWKKAWSDHTDDFDEIEDFYSKNNK